MDTEERGALRRSDRLTNDAKILEAAGRLLAADANAPVSAIAEAAGVARLTVYRRYPNREALIDDLRRTVEAELLDGLARFSGWDQGPAAVGELVAIMTETAFRYPVVLRDHRVDGPSSVDRQLVEVLREGQRAGVLRADLDAGLINGSLFALIRAHHQMRADANSVDTAAEIAEMLLNGVGNRRSMPQPTERWRQANSTVHVDTDGAPRLG